MKKSWLLFNKDAQILTLVKVFYVKPNQQEALADVLIGAGDIISQ